MFPYANRDNAIKEVNNTLEILLGCAKLVDIVKEGKCGENS